MWGGGGGWSGGGWTPSWNNAPAQQFNYQQGNQFRPRMPNIQQNFHQQAPQRPLFPSGQQSTVNAVGRPPLPGSRPPLPGSQPNAPQPPLPGSQKPPLPGSKPPLPGSKPQPPPPLPGGAGAKPPLPPSKPPTPSTPSNSKPPAPSTPKPPLPSSKPPLPPSNNQAPPPLPGSNNKPPLPPATNTSKPSDPPKSTTTPGVVKSAPVTYNNKQNQASSGINQNFKNLGDANNSGFGRGGSNVGAGRGNNTASNTNNRGAFNQGNGRGNNANANSRGGFNASAQESSYGRGGFSGANRGQTGNKSWSGSNFAQHEDYGYEDNYGYDDSYGYGEDYGEGYDYDENYGYGEDYNEGYEDYGTKFQSFEDNSKGFGNKNNAKQNNMNNPNNKTNQNNKEGNNSKKDNNKDNIEEENNKLNKRNLGLGAFLGSISNSNTSPEPTNKTQQNSFNKQNQSNNKFGKDNFKQQNTSKDNKNNTNQSNKNVEEENNKRNKINSGLGALLGQFSSPNSSNTPKSNQPGNNQANKNTPNAKANNSQKDKADPPKSGVTNFEIKRKDDKLLESIDGENIEDVNNKKNKVNIGVAALLGQLRDDTTTKPKEKPTPHIPSASQQGKGQKGQKDDSVAARLAKLAGKPWWCQMCNQRNINRIECVKCGASVDSTVQLGPKPQPWQKKKWEMEQALKANQMKPNFKLGGWACESCFRVNQISFNVCKRCSRHRPAYLKEGTGSWQCAGCYLHLGPRESECSVCAHIDNDYRSDKPQENLDWYIENQEDGYDNNDCPEGYEEYGDQYYQDDQQGGDDWNQGEDEGWGHQQGGEDEGWGQQQGGDDEYDGQLDMPMGRVDGGFGRGGGNASFGRGGMAGGRGIAPMGRGGMSMDGPIERGGMAGGKGITPMGRGGMTMDGSIGRGGMTRGRGNAPMGRGGVRLEEPIGRGGMAGGRGNAPMGRGGMTMDGPIGRGGIEMDEPMGREGLEMDGPIGRGGMHMGRGGGVMGRGGFGVDRGRGSMDRRMEGPQMGRDGPMEYDGMNMDDQDMPLGSCPPWERDNGNNWMSPEVQRQLAEFDKMFEVWEVNYSSWKEANRFNPDKVFVKNYIGEMEEMREKLLSSRKRILDNVTSMQKEEQARLEAIRREKEARLEAIRLEEKKKEEMKNAWQTQQQGGGILTKDEEIREQLKEKANKEAISKEEEVERQRREAAEIAKKLVQADSEDSDDENRPIPGLGEDKSGGNEAWMRQTSTNIQDSNIHTEKPSTGNAAEDIRIQELQAQMKNQQDLINKLINQMKGPAAGANNPALGGGVPPPDNSAFGRVPRPPPPNDTSEPKRGIMEILNKSIEKSKAAQEVTMKNLKDYAHQGSSRQMNEYGGEDLYQKRPAQEAVEQESGFAALRKRLASARSVADVLNSASTNMQAKRPRMEEQGDHEMDMFERKSQMQERPSLPEWRPKAVTDYSQKQNNSTLGEHLGGSRRSEGRGSDGGFSGRGGVNNSRWGNEPRGANNPSWHPENKFDYSRNNSTGNQWEDEGDNYNGRWGADSNNQWGGGQGGNNQWGGGWGNNEDIAPPPKLQREDMEMAEFKPKSFDYGHKLDDMKKANNSSRSSDIDSSYTSRGGGNRENLGTRNRDSSRFSDNYEEQLSGFEHYIEEYDYQPGFGGRNQQTSFGGGSRFGGGGRFSPAAPPPPPAGKRVALNDLILPPGRYTRPPRIVVILRGLPGSGKTYIAKMIKEKETAEGADPPRVMALDDYFESDGQYEYDEDLEDSYRDCLFKSFKKNIDGGLFSFLIVDAVNNRLDHFKQMWSHAKTNGFEVYICEVDCDIDTCVKRNVHDKTRKEVEKLKKDWHTVPDHMNLLLINDKQDAPSTAAAAKKNPPPTQNASRDSPEVISLTGSDDGESSKAASGGQNEDEELEDSNFLKASKWEILDREEKMVMGRVYHPKERLKYLPEDVSAALAHVRRARLDGTTMKRKEGMHSTASSNKLQHKSIEDWLEIGESYSKKQQDGKKRVRWADIEMRKEQAKVKEMGFVIGKKMYTDDNEAEREAEKYLTATKIIPNRFQSEFHNPPP